MATFECRSSETDAETLEFLGDIKGSIVQNNPENTDAQNTQLFRQYMVDLFFRAIEKLEELRTEVTFKEILMEHIRPESFAPMYIRLAKGLRAEFYLELTRVWASYDQITLLTLIKPADYPALTATLKNWRPILQNIEVARWGLSGLSGGGVDYDLLWDFLQRGCSELKEDFMPFRELWKQEITEAAEVVGGTETVDKGKAVVGGGTSS